MSCSFLVPFALNVRLSDSCKLLHDTVGPLLSIVAHEEGGKAVPASVTKQAADRKASVLQYLVTRDQSPHLVACKDDAYACIEEFISTSRSAHHFEQEYLSLAFQEYSMRKGIEEELGLALRELRGTLISAELRKSLEEIVAEEIFVRTALEGTYERFAEWVTAIAPQLLQAARDKEMERIRRSGTIQNVEGVPVSETPRRGDITVCNGSSFMVEGVDRSESGAPHTKMTDKEEHERGERLSAKKVDVETLLHQEEQLRRQIEESRRERKAKEDREREMEFTARYRDLINAEALIQQRISTRENERAELMEHIQAEEELLRQRLAERERQRKLAEEEAARIECEQRGQLFEHIEAEEQLLRRRLKGYQEKRALETELSRRKKEEERDELYEHLRVEEALLRKRLEDRDRAIREADERAREEQIQLNSRLIEDLNRQAAAVGERMRNRKEEEEQNRRQKENEMTQQLRYLADLEERQRELLRSSQQGWPSQPCVQPINHSPYQQALLTPVAVPPYSYYPAPLPPSPQVVTVPLPMPVHISAPPLGQAVHPVCYSPASYSMVSPQPHAYPASPHHFIQR